MRNLARRSSLFAQAGDHTQPLLFQGSLGLCVGVLARRHLHLGGTHSTKLHPQRVKTAGTPKLEIQRPGPGVPSFSSRPLTSG